MHVWSCFVILNDMYTKFALEVLKKHITYVALIRSNFHHKLVYVRVCPLWEGHTQAKTQCHFVQVNSVIESIFKDPKVV